MLFKLRGISVKTRLNVFSQTSRLDHFYTTDHCWYSEGTLLLAHISDLYLGDAPYLAKALNDMHHYFSTFKLTMGVSYTVFHFSIPGSCQEMII